MSQPMRILLGLVLGLGLGLLSGNIGGDWVADAVFIAGPLGGLWLDALQMTIVPLVVALLVTGIARTAEAARANRLAGRAIAFFLVFLWFSAISAAVLMPMFLSAWPIDPVAAQALKGALTKATEVPEVPGFGEFIRSFVPTNPVTAAANNSILQVVIFTLIFAFAMTRLPHERRDRLTGFFEAISDTMLIIINWVLWLGPIGVFALAYAVGAQAGAAAFGALIHYIILVSGTGVFILLVAYPLAVFGGKVGLAQFARAVAPSQAVAISTQSSLASLPTMLRSSSALGVPVAASGVILPIAVALFRATGPAMNLAVALYVAHWFGYEPTTLQIAAGIAIAATTTLGAVSLPGQVSFITSIAPIAVAVGVPIEPLAVLIAVEVIPDIFRTVGNVTVNVAATTAIARRSGIEEAIGETEEDLLLKRGQ